MIIIKVTMRDCDIVCLKKNHKEIYFASQDGEMQTDSKKLKKRKKIPGFARDNSNELHFKHVLLCAKYALHFEPTSCFQLSVYF